MVYCVKNKNTVIAEFDIELTGFGESIKIVHAISNLEQILGMPLNIWLSRRKPVKNRENISNLLKLMNIDNMLSYFDMTYAVSLNDSLWVDKPNSGLTWEKVNVYRKPFNQMVQHLAFDGVGLCGQQLTTVSPEFTTNGMLPKCWKRVNGIIKLYKGGTSGACNAGNEPYSEYFVTQLEEALNLKSYCKYTLGKYHKKIISICDLFTNEDIGFRSFNALFSVGTLSDLIDIINKLDGTDIAYEMFILDALTLNVDRHLNNFGYLVDNATGKILTFAPIFDNGLALVPYYHSGEFKEYIEKNSIGALNEDLISMGKAALDCVPYMKSRLINLHDWKFKNPGYGCSTERVEIANQVVQIQLKKLLSE